MDQNNQDSVDIENPLVSWENSLIQELQSLPPLSSTSTISSVPKHLRNVNEKAYTPQTISVGPFHHGKEDLKAMEEHKKRYLKDFIEWTNSSLRFYIEVVKEKEERLRACYQEAIGFDSEEFVKIILVDAAFIVVFFVKCFFWGELDGNDCIIGSQSMGTKVFVDLMLLENQLPFFILVEFFGYVRDSPPYATMPSIFELCHHVCQCYLYWDPTEEKVEKIQSCNVAHFLDFTRYMILPLTEHPSGQITMLNIPSITELYEAGVRFKVRLGKKFEFQFTEGIFEIATFRLGPYDEIYYRNLIALEQCFKAPNYITDYIVVMSRLVKTQNDVDLLIKYGILENVTHNNKTQLSLLSEITSDVLKSYDEFSFAELFKDLNTYCSKSRHRWIANLKQKYFSTPWTIISVIAGFVLLVLTFIQTVCSVISIQSSNKNGVQN